MGIQVGIGNSVRSVTDLDPPGSGNIWTTEIFDFTADSALTSLSFLGLQGINYIGLDNVDVEFLRAGATPPPTGTVPEPAPLALLGVGLAAAAARRRRANAAKAA